MGRHARGIRPAGRIIALLSRVIGSGVTPHVDSGRWSRGPSASRCGAPLALARVRALVRGDARDLRGQPRGRRHQDARRQRRPERPAARVRGGVRRLRRGRAGRPRRADRRRASTAATGAVADPAFQARVGRARRRPAAAPARRSTAPRRPTFDELIDPFVGPAEAGLVSPDGTTVQVVGNVPGERDRVAARCSSPIPAIVDAARAAHARRRRSTSSAARSSTTTSTSSSTDDLDGSLRLTIPLTFLILLLAFGAIVASVIPLVLAATSLRPRSGSSGCTARRSATVSPNATQLIVLMGLAVAVDYSLFMITRFRTERRHGASRPAGDRGREQHRRAGGVLLGARGDDLARRAGDAGDQPVHVDGGRDDGRRARLGHRQPDVPAGDARDRRRPGEPRPPGDVDPVAAPRLPVAGAGAGPAAIDWLDAPRGRPEGSGLWARLVNAVMGRPVLDDRPQRRAAAGAGRRRSSTSAPA